MADKDGKYPCLEAGCPFVAVTESSARAHADAHTRTVCEFCGKCVARAQLKTHISRRHTSGYVGRYKVFPWKLLHGAHSQKF